LILQDVEITSANPGTSDIDRAIRLDGDNVLADRVLIHNCWRGIQAYGDNQTIKRSYIGDNINPGGDHSTCILSSGGSNGVRILGNHLAIGPDTEASGVISAYPESGANTDFDIIGNLIANSGEYAIRVGYTPPESPNSNFRVIGNWFDASYNDDPGDVSTQWSEVTGTRVWSDNRWYDRRDNGSSNLHGKVVNYND
jgi:hypothetical protein